MTYKLFKGDGRVIKYQDTLEGITQEHLDGFFIGWKEPLSRDNFYTVLSNSEHVVLAVDQQKDRVVGFINSLTDGVQFAFIPMLEVLPEYKNMGIGTELMERMLELLKHYDCVDLTCDPDLQSFYSRFRMLKSHGMVIRRYLDRK
ncbi:MAG TPA: GNAT family N-acetyltransferase [Thermotogota bacterium]|nr:GNAT family N-acetyltransferase [Thermotogota bacterium]HPJ88413.1 GNAT family N-acetyltransferase [Thermotogota bacterium]HPR95420.1 GNAT family N-acetyltransferase [Thermotogota bacterium]